MKRTQLTTTAIALVVGLAGCSADVQPLTERTVTEVGPDGGQALSAMGELSIDFTADALASTQQITIETQRGGSFPRVRSPIYALGPDGLTFETPVTVTVSVVGIEVAADETLALANVDGRYPEILPSSDWAPGATEVRATLEHFSSYAVVTVYNPCAAKACSDPCTVCDPLDTACVEPAPVNKTCNRSGLCVDQAIVMCAPPVDAGVAADAGAPVDTGVAADASFVRGQRLGRLRCGLYGCKLAHRHGRSYLHGQLYSKCAADRRHPPRDR